MAKKKKKKLGDLTLFECVFVCVCVFVASVAIRGIEGAMGP